MDIRQTLELFVSHPHLHAKWLNSLSYLEYRGFRKIVKSQSSDQMTLDRLLHTMEEVRHAVMFKRLAVKVGGPAFKSYSEDHLLGGTALKMFFTHLDNQVAPLLKSQHSQDLAEKSYQIITWLIEKRATQIYLIYDDILQEKKFDFSLYGILKEEEKHLHEVELHSEKLISQWHLEKNQIFNIEQSLFISVWKQLQKEAQLFVQNTSVEVGLHS